MNSDARFWHLDPFRHLDRRQVHMRPKRPAAPAFSADEGEGVTTGAMPVAPGARLAWADIAQDLMQGLLWR